MKRLGYFKLPERLWGLAESICISFCASVATFPVLVLRGLSVSIYAVASSVAVLWLIQPMMLLGLGTAFAGLVPALAPLYGVLSAASAALTGLLDRWAVWISAKPGAGIYFDTAYAAIVCLVLILLCWLAFTGGYGCGWQGHASCWRQLFPSGWAMLSAGMWCTSTL